MKKWTNESDRGSIVIETLTHPLNDSKALIPLRQFRMNEVMIKSSKAAFGDMMIIHSDNLNLFINRLQTIRDNLIDKTFVDEIVIDEWHINTEQSKLRMQLSQFVAEEIRILYGLVARETCHACEINEPSQSRHQCCQEPQKKLPNLFEQLIRRIDWPRFSGELENVDVEALLDDEE